MLCRLKGRHRTTLRAHKADDTAGFVAAPRDIKVTPHVAQNNTNPRSFIDGWTTRQPGYAVSIRIRKKDRGDLRLGHDLRQHAQGALRPEGQVRRAFHGRDAGNPPLRSSCRRKSAPVTTFAMDLKMSCFQPSPTIFFA